MHQLYFNLAEDIQPVNGKIAGTLLCRL